MMKRIIRYCVLGGLGSVIYLGVTMAFVEILGFQPTVASIVGFLCVLLIVYLPNLFWVFDSTRAHRSSFPRFVIVSGVGLLGSTAAMYGAVNIIGLNYMWGVLGATAVVPPVNFILNSYWTFR